MSSVSDGVWTSFRGAGLLSAGGIAAMGEAGTLAILKIFNSVDTDQRALQTILLVTKVALTSIALGAAMVVTAAASAAGSYIVAGAAGLFLTAEIADKCYLIASLAIATYTVYLHYQGFRWAFTPYSL